MTQQEVVLEQIEKQAEDKGWPIIGWQKGRLLVEVVEKYKPKLVLEVGTLIGYSAILMSRYLPDDAKIITLEINSKIAELARENFTKAGISERIELKIGDALDIIPALSGRFDLVFLDAAKQQYIQYLKLVEDKLSPNAIIVADNVKKFAREMADFLDYVRESGRYVSKTHDFGFDAVEVSLKKAGAGIGEKL